MAMPMETRCPMESQETCSKTYFALGRPVVEFHWPIILILFYLKGASAHCDRTC